MDCTIRIVKIKALISFAVTAKLICVFLFAYAKSWFSHNGAQLRVYVYMKLLILEGCLPCQDHPWARGRNYYCSGYLGHMTRMASTLINGENPSQISRTKGPGTLLL